MSFEAERYRQVHLYADTSVFGGCFDDEFQEASRKLFDEILAGRFFLALSETTIDELAPAPEHVRRLLRDVTTEDLQVIRFSEEIGRLRDAYLAAGVVGPASRLDAEHIAAASVADVDLIVSWNFQHIVHFEKIRGYHGVNLVKGYSPIPIHSPREVIEWEE